MNKTQTANYFILKLESYEGEDTYLHCGDNSQNYIYCIVKLTHNSELDIVDNGYRSVSEALAAWPEAKPTTS
jgi:hypothetical protein